MTQRDFGWNSCLNGHLAVLAAFALNLHSWHSGVAWALLGFVCCGVAWGSAWISSGMSMQAADRSGAGADALRRTAETGSNIAAGVTVAAWACFVLPALIALV